MTKPANKIRSTGATRACEEFLSKFDIVILIACYDEGATIEKVVADFRQALPSATIFVYDNNSNDRTAQIARRAGAIVRTEELQGKGNVVRRMFADIDADIFVMVDGDDTYVASDAPCMIERLVHEALDMVNGKRVSKRKDAYPRGHLFGNWALTSLVAVIFGKRFEDMLSGYRVLSRRFVKSFPALAMGFEIETELTVHALELRMPVDEMETEYKSRPAGSESKLRTWRDGLTILTTIAVLVKEERPLQFFTTIAILLCGASIVIAWPLLTTYMETNLVPRIPTAILSTGMILLGFLSFASGLILDTVTKARREVKRMMYLNVPRFRSPKKLKQGARDQYEDLIPMSCSPEIKATDKRTQLGDQQVALISGEQDATNYS